MLESSPFWQLTLTRVREFVREPSVLFWTFGFPVLLSVALGLAFRNRGPEKTVVGVLDGPGAAERAVALERAGIEARRLAETEVQDQLRSGRVALLVVPGDLVVSHDVRSPSAPAGSPRLSAQGRGSAQGSSVVYRYDTTRLESRLARRIVDDALERAAGRRDTLAKRDETVTEPGSRYIDFLIPGMIGMNVMSGSMWGIGWAIVNMRVRKLLRRLRATPMRRSHFLLTHGVTRLVFVGFELTLLLVFARLLFDVRVHGSLATLVALVLGGAMCFSGLATMLASRSESTQAVSGLLNLFMMPMFVLSGVFFSSAHFPDAMQPFIRILPLTALNDGLRAVMIDGRPATGLAREAAVLAGWGVLGFAVGLKAFKWR